MRGFALIALVLVGCNTSYGPVEPAMPTDLTVQARGIGATSTEDVAFGATMDIAEVLGQAFGGSEAADFSVDGHVELTDFSHGFCVALSVDNGALVMTFDGCAHLSGSLRLTHWLGETTLWFEDDFMVGDVDIDGHLAVTARFLAGEFGFEGSLAWGEHTLLVDLDLHTSSGDPELWGFVDLELETPRGPLMVRTDLGSKAAPLVYEGGCTCPTQGGLTHQGSITIDSVFIDLDDLLVNEPDVGTFPTIEVPIESETLESSLDVSFDAACGDAVATVTADDVTLEIAGADVVATLQELCDEGRFGKAQCATLIPASESLPKTIDVEVPLSLVAGEVESSVQDKLDHVCLSFP